MDSLIFLSSVLSSIIYCILSKFDINDDFIDTFFKIGLTVCITMIIVLSFKVVFNGI